MSSITLRFLAGSNTVNYGDRIHGGTVMKWIDEAGYACAASWSKRHCMTAFTGSIRFQRPIRIGDLVEIEARLAFTGTTSMNIAIEVRSSDLKGGAMEKITDCLMVFVSVGLNERPAPVATFSPVTPGEMALAERARTQLATALAAVEKPPPRGPDRTAAQPAATSGNV